MHKKVKIKLHSEQYQDGEQTLSIASEVNGIMDTHTQEDLIVLRYQEPEEENLGKTWTSLYIQLEKPKIEIHHGGAVRCSILLEPAKRHQFSYQTPLGTLELTTQAENIFVAFDEKRERGNLAVSYTLLADGIPVSKIRLQWEIAEVSQ